MVVMNKTIIHTKYSQKVLSSDIFIYRVSGFICYLRHTILIIFSYKKKINISIQVIVIAPIGANSPANNAFLGKSPTKIKYTNYIIAIIKQYRTNASMIFSFVFVYVLYLYQNVPNI